MMLPTTQTGETDPLVVAIVSVSLTLIVGLAVGLVAALLARKGEHSKWLREQRYEAYVAFMTDMNAMTALIETTPTLWNAFKLLARVEALTEKARAAFEAVSLLGPLKVNAAGQHWVWAASAYSKSKTAAEKTTLTEARWQFLIAAGETLKSRNVAAEPMVRSGAAPSSAEIDGSSGRRPV